MQNGVLSPHAWLDLGDVITTDCCFSFGSTVGIYLNDHLVKNVPITSLPACVQIDTQYIKFAQRGATGQPSTPAVNRIGATLDVSQSNINAVDGILFFGALSLKAMSPIILVHGILTDQTWFTANGFNVPLDQAKVPYVVATKPNSQSLDPGTIPDTGATLDSVVPSLAAEFGATKVHIVAHSKGGLWSRYFLKYGLVSTNVVAPPTPANFGVLSLTTLDTPHDGSILADVLLGGVSTAYLLGVINGAPSLVDFLLSGFVGTDIPQISDLTRDQVGQFNLQTVDPPSSFKDVDGMVYNIAYSSVAADADIGDKTNSHGTRYVDSTDCAGMDEPTLLCGVLYGIVGSEDYLYAVLSGNVFASPSSFTFDLNDMVVTQNSARAAQIPPFVSVQNGPLNPYPWALTFDPLRKNHATVGDSCVSGGGASCTTGSGVLGVIQQIQPMQ